MVGDFQPGLNGFFVQQDDALQDADPSTSEGIFVFDRGKFQVSAGDLVRVRGKVEEFKDLTELKSVSAVKICAQGASVTPTALTLPINGIDAFEALEGMLVTFPQKLYIVEHFNFDRFNEIVLSNARQYQPTQLFEPGSSQRAALAQANLRGRITLDDNRIGSNSAPALHPNGGVFDLRNRFRGGDTLQNVTGVLDHAFGSYRIRPTRGAIYAAANPRPPGPGKIKGRLKVASFNLQNYFSTLDNGGLICGPHENRGCRGAQDVIGFERQHDKIVSTIATMDADIVGLIEIENHPLDYAVDSLVDGLNAVARSGNWAAIGTGAIGDDAIKVALIYQSASVAPVGDFAILDSHANPAYPDRFNRPALAQTFEENASGERLTVVVNHLKSKASACDEIGDFDARDGQGNCNQTRKAALAAEAAWLATDPTGSGDADFLIIGDFNAYAKEDPIDSLRAAGYIDLLDDYIGASAYSYLFAAELGYLDHAFANEALRGQVNGATIWHINVDEPDIIGFDTGYGPTVGDAPYAPDPYRSSDHDPLIVGLDLFSDGGSNQQQ